jgi:hypothetical protein
MYLATWFVLFSSAAVASLTGLIVSASFRDAVSIYIMIPMLLVPQIMLGGSAIPYDELIRKESPSRNVPWVANIMPSRWGFEALVVHQYAVNAFLAPVFQDDCTVKQCDYVEMAYLPEIRAQADYPLLENTDADRGAQIRRRLEALRPLVRVLETETGQVSGVADGELLPQAYSRKTSERVKAFLDTVSGHYRRLRDEAAARVDRVRARLKETLGSDGYRRLEKEHFNRGIADLVQNIRSLDPVQLAGERLVQIALPICHPPESRFGQAPFFAAEKRLGDHRVGTFAFNGGILWGMALLLYGALCLIDRVRPLSRGGS